MTCGIAGGGLTLLGVMLFFQKHLIRLGNILLVAAMPSLVGPSRLMRFVLARKSAGSVFLLGFVFTLWGHPLIGLLVEAFGFLNLFGNLFPIVGAMLRNVPGIGPMLSGLGGGGGGGARGRGGGARHARGAEAEYDEYGDGVYDDYAGDDDYYQPQQQQY